MSAEPGKLVHVAVGVVWRDGRVLIARRQPGAHQGGLLEFPGGKVEPGESVREALVRELREETAITVAPDDLQPLIGIRHDYGDKVVLLDVWEVHDSRGEPHGVEGQPVFWMAPGSLTAADFPAANRAIIAAVRLPATLAISGDVGDPETALAMTRAGLTAADKSWVMLRMPSLAPAAYTEVVRKVRAQNPQLPLLTHDRPELVTDLAPAGVHLSWRQACRLAGRPVTKEHWFGVSCHDDQQLAHAAAIGADYATLGPVLPTPSHPQAPGMGWQRFSRLAGSAALPVYALGGVGPGDLARARSAGGQGVAGISWWWPVSNNESEAR